MASSGVVGQMDMNARPLALSGHVGFDSLPDQLVNKSTSQGFCFNILCIGETGIGKSTLMDTLFNTNFENFESSHFEPKVRLRAQTYDLQESNVRLKLTVVNTVGFGDQMNKQQSYQHIVDYIDTQFESYLQEELKIKRSLHNYHDSRIHACLNFIAPSGHSLKSLDLVTMKKLDSKVNIIPVIAKADTISKSELHKFKIKIMSELVSNGVQIYQFPIDDETVANINTAMNSSADVRGEAAGVCGRAAETRGGDATDVCAESRRERVRAERRRERAAGQVRAAEATACGGEEQAGGEAPESGEGDERLQQAQSCQRAPAGAGLQHQLQQQKGQRAQEWRKWASINDCDKTVIQTLDDVI
ncbi:septin-10 isoform X1 [Sinocyclocheilus anshuiensis]|uniref:septin-10 isoform X1 n=1 Tax=Sinocyclocheilus anshuiensis TaxID=1608454 RepID=UPI0007B8A674|nr:PREDICTED: septin-10 isoform X1 [Sinocyclocheilus anshuiensis]